MSTAVQLPNAEPEPTPPASGDADGWALLEGLRRRLDDQAAQGRKTASQVSQLAESIAALVDVQRRRTRSLNLNSFIAYVIFTVLCGSGFYLLYRSRANELTTARDQAVTDRDTATHRADDAAAKLAARDAADAKAWDIYQLLEGGKHRDAIAKLAALADAPLSRTERAVLAARAHETQVIEAETAVKAAAAAIKAGHHADAVAPLEAALVSEPTGARAAQMHYYLGVAYAKLGDLAKATTHLDAAIAADVDQEDARFQLASVLDRSTAYVRARAEYDRFATAHPQSPLAVFAMRRSATLAHLPAQLVVPPIAPPIAPPKVVPPPPVAKAVAPPPVAKAAAPPPAAKAVAPPTPPVASSTPVAPPPITPPPVAPAKTVPAAPEVVPEATLELPPLKPVTPPALGELPPPAPKPPAPTVLEPSPLQPTEDPPTPPPPPPPPRDPLPPLKPAPPPPPLPVPPPPDPCLG